MTYDPMVTTLWLAERLDDPAVRVFDASWFMPGSTRDPVAEYVQAHIPGAVRFDIDAVSDAASDLPHMLAPPSEFAMAMRRGGVNPESVVVAYDSEGLFSAPRLWWNLRAMGHQAAFVLDGGLPRWIAEGRPVETGWRDAVHGAFRAHPDPALVRALADMTEILASGSAQIIDARSAGRFHGQDPEPRPGLRSGHMPGALNVPWTSVVKDGSLLPSMRLAEVFVAAGVELADPIVTSCGSGISAAVVALALARLGRLDVALYDGSWSEWGARTDTPVAPDPAA
jgi:thiosulfate/3-mercaptopyruvate sulfurtransferase